MTNKKRDESGMFTTTSSVCGIKKNIIMIKEIKG